MLKGYEEKEANVMRMYDLIMKKRNGGALTGEERSLITRCQR